MGVLLNRLEDIKKYNPYIELVDFREDEYFEGNVLEYLRQFTISVNELKERLGHKYDKKVQLLFSEVIKKRNDEEIEKILSQYLSTSSGNEDNISLLKKSIRQIKDIILMSEEPDMKRLRDVDKRVGEVIDKFSKSLSVSSSVRVDGFSIEEILDNFANLTCNNIEDYDNYVTVFRKRIEEICNHYRNNYSVDTAAKYIRSLKTKVDKLLDNNANNLELYASEEKRIDDLVLKYNSFNLFSSGVSEFKTDINCMKDRFRNDYSSKMAKKLIKILDMKTGEVLDVRAKNLGLLEVYEKKLCDIFKNYEPENLDIFDMIFYSSKEEMEESKRVYDLMSVEAKRAFEMRIYEQYVRNFKGKIRELNKEIRNTCSVNTANKLINSINRRADKFICNRAKKIGKPVPKNPWFVRKYLWADTDNFVSEKAIKVRRFINPVLRCLVKVAMNNKVVMEEQAKLDPTKQYIFVPTHYFTEDAIGMFASLDRQAYMLMGTTDQIENNPLMAAAVLFGFFHVDRMDNTNRKECVTKQNRIIDCGGSFINYVSGSWENSENELQPLSFSGPYRTCFQKEVQIVPVGLYLSREEKKIYVRYGEPMDLHNCEERVANETIRDTLASIHFKQMQKFSVPIETVEIDGYGKTHNLPYDQHTYYMDQVCAEYWNQPWSKPFAVEEIAVRRKKTVDEVDVYSFMDDLSRDKLIQLSNILAEPLLRIDERKRYDMVTYIDTNYDRYKNYKEKNKVRVRKRKQV